MELILKNSFKLLLKYLTFIFMNLTKIIISFKTYLIKSLLFNKIKIYCSPNRIKFPTISYDYIFSLCLIIVPSFIFMTKLFIYSKLILFILVQLLITIPLLTLLSKKYNWEKNSNNIIKSFKHPHFLLTFSIGIIYPLLWGLFFSLSRYLRLGNTLNIFDIFADWLDFIILIIFLIPNIIIWLLVITSLFTQLRQLLWEYTENLCFSVHLFALQYYDYFRLCQLLHKSHFIIYDLFFQHPGAYYRQFDEQDKIPYFIKFTKIIQYFYYKPYVLHCIFILTIVLELFFYKGKLYFGLYTLFIYPGFMSCLRLYHIIGSQNLVLNMSKSDYLFSNFENPRYALNFWFFANNTELWYEFKYDLPTAIITNWQNRITFEQIVYANYTKFHLKLPYRVHGYKINHDFMKSVPRIYGFRLWTRKPYNIRLAALYKSQYATRWYHSTPVLRYPQKTLFHPYTAKFVKDPYAILALLNNPNQKFSLIQQLAKDITMWPKPNELYAQSSNILLDNPNQLTDVLENNFAARFTFLANKNVIIGTYHAMKERYGYANLETMQLRPDLVTNWINNKEYTFKGYLAVDEKHKVASVTNYGRHQAINSINHNEYVLLLNNFKDELIKKKYITQDMIAAIEHLKVIASEKDFNKLLDVWSNYLHLFPEKWKPPLMIEKTFDESHLTQEAIKKIRAGELILQRISDQLYEMKFPTDKAQFSEKALDYFHGSNIQKLFKDTL